MSRFRYEVSDRSGSVLRGVMDAPSEADVRQRLIARGYEVNVVVSTTPQAAPSPPRAVAPAVARSSHSRQSAPPRELAVFFRSLQQYLRAGITVYDALSRIASQTACRGLQLISERMASKVQSGLALSDAMSEFPRAFPQHVIGVVAAGEMGGFLPVVAGDIALDYELAQRASSVWMTWIVRALWLNVIGIIVIAPLPAMMFSPGVEDVQSLFAKYLSWVIPYRLLPLGIALASYLIVWHLLRMPELHELRSRLVLLAPGYGRVSRDRSLAVFMRILWRLQNAGILPISAWEAASSSAENAVVSAKLGEQVATVRMGRKLSDALSATGLLRGDDLSVLSAAEHSGQTADALERIAAYYEDSAKVAASRARTIGLRFAVIACIVAAGYAMYCIEIKRMLNMFEWVDRFMGTE